MLSGIMKGITINDRMSYGKIIIIVAFTFAILGCTTEGTSTKKGRFGHWIYSGSSTFPQVFQCVETFKPHKNTECE